MKKFVTKTLQCISRSIVYVFLPVFFALLAFDSYLDQNSHAGSQIKEKHAVKEVRKSSVKKGFEISAKALTPIIEMPKEKPSFKEEEKVSSYSIRK